MRLGIVGAQAFRDGASSVDLSRRAIDITGGHEDANHFNPEQHVLSNATRADRTKSGATWSRMNSIFTLSKWLP